MFFFGMVVYGIVLNSGEMSLKDLAAEKGLDSFKNVKIVIRRDKYVLELYSDSTLVKTYKVVFGRNNSAIKERKDDYITPLGDYIICSIDTGVVYYKYFKINYPNEKDAAEAFRKGTITTSDFKKIMNSLEGNDCSYTHSALGADIGIHGIGKYDFVFSNLPFAFNWTNGSIALSNASIDELYSIVKPGTPVIIRK